jgi:hypothetical protein
MSLIAGETMAIKSAAPNDFTSRCILRMHRALQKISLSKTSHGIQTDDAKLALKTIEDIDHEIKMATMMIVNIDSSPAAIQPK